MKLKCLQKLDHVTEKHNTGWSLRYNSLILISKSKVLIEQHDTLNNSLEIQHYEARIQLNVFRYTMKLKCFQKLDFVMLPN